MDLRTLQIQHHVYDGIRSFQTEKRSPSNRIDEIVRARKPRLYGHIVRSRRQAAFWLSQSFNFDSLCQMGEKLGATLVRDLSRNLAPLIRVYRRDTAFGALIPPQI